MGSVNKVILVGHLGADPEIRSFQNGGKVANFSIATSESWKDRNSGERQERTEWHRIAIFNEGLVGVAERFLRKGSQVYVEGQLRTRKWQDQQGNDRYQTEVVLQGFNATLTLLDKREGGSSNRYEGQPDPGSSDGWGGGSSRGSSGGSSGGGWGNTGGGSSGGGFSDDFDDDIPF